MDEEELLRMMETMDNHDSDEEIENFSEDSLAKGKQPGAHLTKCLLHKNMALSLSFLAFVVSDVVVFGCVHCCSNYQCSVKRESCT